MSYVSQTTLFKVLDESFIKISKILTKQGVKNHNIMLYSFPAKIIPRFKIGSIAVEDNSGKQLIFDCDLIVHSFPCGCSSVVIKAHDIARNLASPAPKYLSNCRLGKDDKKIPSLSTSYFNKKLTSQILVADIQLGKLLTNNLYHLTSSYFLQNSTALSRCEKWPHLTI